MKITKLGHCCLIVEVDGVRILTDPGAWTTAQNEVTNIDLILITHEHQDHFHLESLKAVMSNNPQAVIYTNSAVGALLHTEGIEYHLVEDGHSAIMKGVKIEGYGQEHAAIYPTIPSVMNTGYMINGQFFYPGDALFNPGRDVEILALPVVGPWIKIAEAIDYAKAIHPKICFPVHDGMLKIHGPFHLLPEKILTLEGIKFVSAKEGDILKT